MSVYNPFDFFLEPEAENFPFAYAPELAHDLAPYLAKGELTPRFKAFVDSVSREPLRTIDFLVGLNQRLQQRDPLPDPHGAGRADARGHAGQRLAARAATPAGCWCRCCATWGWRRASSPAT